MTVEDIQPAPCAVAQAIHRVLPQTQCRRCGQPDCAAYAQAIASGDAPINQCPPGGKDGIARIAQVMGRPELAQGQDIDPACGVEGPMAVAVIDENWCIGCTMCMRACPTDAIVGSRKRMHTVLSAYCTGCELCVLACPVDCIAMKPVGNGVEGPLSTGWQTWTQAQADQALQRYTQRQQRLRQRRDGQQARKNDEAADSPHAIDASGESDAQARKRRMIEAALARARSARS